MAGLTIDADDLESVMAEGWWPLEHARLGAWLLRASAGFTGRGNSALPVGDPGVDLSHAVDRVEQFYRSRGLRPRFAVPGPEVGVVTGGPIAPLLAARGYAVETPTAVMVAPAGEVANDAAGFVELRESPDDAWLQLYRYRGLVLPPEASRLLTSAPYQRFAAVVNGGETVAVGRLAISSGWGGVTAMQVAETHRGRGLARGVLTALAAHAVDHGVTLLYLQVAADNLPARSLYSSAGFTDHHGYHYRTLWQG